MVEKKKILIVDDEEQDRKGIAVALKKQGYADISFAQSADEGLKAVYSFNPDIVLIDVVLAHIDGFDVCRKLRDDGIKTKIIMITGHLDAIEAAKARKSGADEIIEKMAGFGNIAVTIERLS